MWKWCQAVKSYTALQAGVPGGQIHFQGNNKSVGELTMCH